jgi:DNA-3-methyladenine glycosylase
MADHGELLDRRFFARTPLEVAPELLGCVIANGPVAVRLTEVEAYDGANDPGSHAFTGPTSRNEVMFGPPGRGDPRHVPTAILPAGQPGWRRHWV